MCWEDVRIQRHLKTKIYTGTADANIPANPNRLALRLTLTYISPDNSPVDSVRLRTSGSIADGTQFGNQILATVWQTTVAGGVDPVAAFSVHLQETVTIDEVGEIIKSNLTIDTDSARRWFLYESSLEENGPPQSNY